MRWTSFLAFNCDISSPSARCSLNPEGPDLCASRHAMWSTAAIKRAPSDRRAEGDPGEVVDVGAEQCRFDQRTLLDRGAYSAAAPAWSPSLPFLSPCERCPTFTGKNFDFKGKISCLMAKHRH